MKTVYGAIIGCALSIMASCHSSSANRAAKTTTTGAPMLLNDDAAMLVTRMRCQRENACDRVGAYRRFTDRDACARELFPEAMATVEPVTCPAGVDESKLETCLGDIRAQRCEDEDRILPSCRHSQLCQTR